MIYAVVNALPGKDAPSLSYKSKRLAWGAFPHRFQAFTCLLKNRREARLAVENKNEYPPLKFLVPG